MIEKCLILRHFAAARWGRPRTRARLEAVQARKLRRFLRRVVRDSSYYAGLRPELAALPVIGKAEYLGHFAALNPLGIRREEAMETALQAESVRDFRGELRGGLTVGLSSGTSGERHAFLVSRADRCRWAGRTLARLLSPESLRRILNPLARPLGIAFILRANSNLYGTLASRRVDFRYYDLTLPIARWTAALAASPPDVLIAPATVLAELARREIPIRPRQVISVAEVLDERDRAAVSRYFGVPVQAVYQAAEGFLGSTCRAGRMHLHEESLWVETEWLDAGGDRFRPVITDFSRAAQWFVRYRMEDILRRDPTPCPCGDPAISLREIEGRADEVLWLPGRDGGLSPVFPDAVRQAMYSLAAAPDEYRIEQHGLRWDLCCRSGDAGQVARALSECIARQDLAPPRFVTRPWTEQPPAEKRRRIRCISRPGPIP